MTSIAAADSTRNENEQATEEDYLINAEIYRHLWYEPLRTADCRQRIAKELRIAPLRTLYESKQYSDMAIVCGRQVLRAHRNILCTRSSVLAAAIKPAWSNNTRPEVDDPAALEGIVSVVEHSITGAAPVEQMIEYIYTGAFKMQPSQAELDAARAGLVHASFASRYCMMLACIELRIVADFYLLQDLVVFVEGFFKQLVDLTPGITKSPLFVNLVKKVMTDTPLDGDMVTALIHGAALYLDKTPSGIEPLHREAQDCREVFDFTFKLLGHIRAWSDYTYMDEDEDEDEEEDEVE